MPISSEGVGATAERTALETPPSLHVAVVCAIDGARFAVVAESESACLAQIATYVAEQASVQLWPRSAGRIRELLAAGDATAAIAEYFYRSGERWDAEWLHVTCLRGHARSAAWSGSVPVPTRGDFTHRSAVQTNSACTAEEIVSLRGARSDLCGATTGRDTMARSDGVRHRGMSR
jgi:hypothetical protein